jgi:hypothetical protein
MTVASGHPKLAGPVYLREFPTASIGQAETEHEAGLSVTASFSGILLLTHNHKQTT